MREEILRQIIVAVCDGFVDTLLTGIEEYEKIFPILLLVLIL